MKVVVKFFLDEVSDKLVYRKGTSGSDLLASEFGLSLTFEHRLLDAHRNRRHKTVAYVGELISLARKLP